MINFVQCSSKMYNDFKFGLLIAISLFITDYLLFIKKTASLQAAFT